jgi:peptidase E
MSRTRGLIVLMGSGELTATMVEVHKEILGRLEGHGKSVFLDTPAGFQLNADELSQRAVEYFRTRVLHPMYVVSYKSKDVSPLEAEKAFRELRNSDYVLVGPGSPTYAVKQWQGTPIPETLSNRIRDGGCFVAASAAALTVGKFTMPVYEIYKVGEDLRWEKGMNILGDFGMNYVVIPHWNNAEGGTHDTRCCFVGESRFQTLSALLPEDVGVLGLDEHTACIIDLETEEVEVRGIGSLTVRHGDTEKYFQRGSRIPLDVLRAIDIRDDREKTGGVHPPRTSKPGIATGSFWDSVHTIERTFNRGLDEVPEDATNAVLELDRKIWQAKKELENEEFITQARETFREMIVLIGNRLASTPKSVESCLSPLVDTLLELRENFRKNKQWKESDMIRDCLKKHKIIIEDTSQGSRWRFSR